MKPEKKAERTLQKLQEYLLATGVDPEALKQAQQTPVQSRDESSLEAEAVLAYVDNPKSFLRKVCKRCEEPFLANFQSVAYCSDHCRSRALAQLGVQWNPHRSMQDRWRGNPPMIVPAAALRQIASLATQASLQIEMEQEQLNGSTLTPEQTQEEAQAQSNGSRTTPPTLLEILDFDTSVPPFEI